MKTRSLILVLLFVCGALALNAQAAGDYRSTATGNWSALGTWQIYSGTVWNAATAIPSSITDVYIQSNHTVTLTAASACRNLSIAKGNTSGNDTYGRLVLAAYNLDLSGSLRVYYAAIGTIPGANSAVASNMLITSSGGVLHVIGHTRSLLIGAWDGNFTGSTSLFPIVVDPGSGITISIGSTLRAQSWTIVSGTLNMAAAAVIHADNGSSNQGNVTVNSGALLIFNGSGNSNSVLRRISGKKGGTFTVNGTVRFTGAAPYIAMSVIAFNGTTEYSGNNQTLANFGGDGSVNVNSYANLVLSGSGTVTLPYAISVGGDVVVAPGVTLTLNGHLLSLTNPASYSKSVTGSGPIFIDLPALTIDSKAFNTDVTLSSFASSVTAYAKFLWKPIEVDLVGGGETFNIGGASMAGKNVKIRHSLGFTPMNIFWRMKNGNDIWGGWNELSTGLDGTFAQFTLPVKSEGDIQVVFPETINSTIETLPVELSSFTAVPTAEYFVELHWTTQSETNVSGYNVLRSNSVDLSSALLISQMVDATNTASESTYSFIDDEVLPGTWYYWLKINELDGSFVYHGPVVVTLNHNPNDPGIPDIPSTQGIRSIYPNPFNPSATIAYNIPQSGIVRIDIYNLRGEHIRNLYSGIAPTGANSATWDGKTDSGRDCTSGVYYARLKAGSLEQTRKMMMLK